jgi:nicotinate-nucleotide adenylyltransferase
MKLCVYFGTFNPIHTAHLAVAEGVKEQLNIDKVFFIPAYNPPHRQNDLVDPIDRLNMAKLAVCGNKSFEVSDIEYKREGKSYTYITIKELMKIIPNLSEKIDFIIGTDAFSHIDSWYEVKKLSKLVRFVIIPREENFDTEHLFERIELKDFDYAVVNLPFIDISSSYIRKLIKEGKSIKYLVSDEVADYIKNNGLYK